ncbi:hypothetical protein Pfo_026625 [Paulownia fortunei]|nr:hypothetical protein Pfo_026625 [Paulownia fortunei]
MAGDLDYGYEKSYVNFWHKFGENLRNGVTRLLNDGQVFGLVHSIPKNKELSTPNQALYPQLTSKDHAAPPPPPRSTTAGLYKADSNQGKWEAKAYLRRKDLGLFAMLMLNTLNLQS